jgi:glycosyltransferase involved in cell wall biosynthesis
MLEPTRDDPEKQSLPPSRLAAAGGCEAKRLRIHRERGGAVAGRIDRTGGCVVMVLAKKTLLHLTPMAAIGGCEVDCLRIVQELGDYDHQVVVFDDYGPMSAQWKAAGARVDHLSAWQHGKRKFQSVLAAWAESQPQPTAIFYWSTSRLPVVINILRGWDVPWCVHLGNPVSKGFIPRVRRWMQERLNQAPRNTTLVACSNYVAASHRGASYFRRFPTEVIYNPVTAAFDQARKHRELPAGSIPRVGMVARLDSIKDHSTVIRALAAIAPGRPDVMVEFAGDGHLHEALEREAHRLGVADRVRFLGFTQVAPLLAQWDVYVYSTTASEGMGTAIAEAMMAGLPCIVSDLTVMREVCGESDTLYFPAANAAALGQTLVQLIENRARRETLGLAAQSRARRMFAVAQVAKAYLRVVSPIQ